MSDLGALSRRLDALARALPPLVHAISPTNWSEEIDRLSEAWRRKIHTEPRFVYRPLKIDPTLPEQLDELRARLPSRTPEERALAARGSNLALELQLLLAVGTPRLAALARQRFSCAASEDERAASWAALEPAPGEDDEILSDSNDARSLLSVARREVAARRLPVRVVVRDGLCSLAAFGAGVLLVAAGRRVSASAARRTALHEVLGHALPWWERQRAQRWLDPAEADQEEGAALLVEERAGMMDAQRKKELGLRHVAARMVHEGEPFRRIVESMEDLDMRGHEAVRLAARVSRGGGLGRERAYLPWFWRLGG